MAKTRHEPLIRGDHLICGDKWIIPGCLKLYITIPYRHNCLLTQSLEATFLLTMLGPEAVGRGLLQKILIQQKGEASQLHFD